MTVTRNTSCCLVVLKFHQQHCYEAVKTEEVEIKVKLSKPEGKSLIWKEINNQWNQHWKQEEKGRHLYKLQSVVGEKERENK